MQVGIRGSHTERRVGFCDRLANEKSDGMVLGENESVGPGEHRSAEAGLPARTGSLKGSASRARTCLVFVCASFSLNVCSSKSNENEFDMCECGGGGGEGVID